MGSLVSFRRKLDSLVLEEVKQQAKQSWLSSQTMPTEIVDALVIEVERLWARFNRAHCRVLDLEQALNAGWGQERLRIQKAEAEIEQLRRELHDERVRRDEREKMYNQAVTGTEVERLRAKVEEWKAVAEEIKRQRDRARVWVERLRAELAEAEFIIHTHEHALNERDKVLTTEHQLRRETEQCYGAALTMARHRGDRLEKAEALAALVTLELAELLGRLGNCIPPYTFDDPYKLHQCVEDRKDARALAARIREALEANDD